MFALILNSKGVMLAGVSLMSRVCGGKDYDTNLVWKGGRRCPRRGNMGLTRSTSYMRERDVAER